MRHYIRHPVDIPIEVDRSAEPAPAHSENISAGGLALRCSSHVESGNIVSVRIPYVEPAFETNARVAWCRECDEGFELGVEFLGADDAFRARMVEQVCSIESYRKSVYETERRSLSSQEAAFEWIEKHASHFPGAAPEDMH